MTHATALEHQQQRLAGMGLGGLLAISFALNVYLLFLQPLGVLSLRRLILAAAIGAVLSAAVWLYLRRGRQSLADWWRRWVIRERLWRAGLLLSAVIHLIYPAPPGQLLALPVELQVEFSSLSASPAGVRLVSLNNGMVDISYKDLRLDETAEIRPGSGIHLTVEGESPAKIRWSGRVWQTLTLIFSSDQPIEILIRYQNREERLRFDAPQTIERKITLPVGRWWYYGLVKIGILLLATVSLAVLAALLRTSPLWEDGWDTLGNT
jgi:hypothetical protein